MKWLEDYRQDIQRYTAYSRGSALVQVLMQQGLWALLQYRVASAIYRSEINGTLKRALLLLAVLWQKLIEVSAGISLPYTATIAPGLYIGHFGNIIVNGNAVIGSSCNLSQGVTIGVSGRNERRGVPVICDRVYIGANAVLVGQIRVGNDVVVAANSLVNSDIPDHCTAIGVPASVVSFHGALPYIFPESA
jgi:serine O-acetyltransferase